MNTGKMQWPKTINTNQRLTIKEKNANKQQWYKDMANRMDTSRSKGRYVGEVSDRDRMQSNYDLFNSKLNLEKFEYVCNPMGAKDGGTRAKMTHKDISSGKIKSVMGMEAARPYIWRAIAVNREATSVREKEEMGKIQEYVDSRVMGPIRNKVIMSHHEEMQGRDLTEHEKQQIQKQIDSEVKAMTPDEIKKYMAREFQTPIEVQSNQLLEYFHGKLDLKYRFQKAFKHGALSAYSVMYVGAVRGEPEAWNISSKAIFFEKSADSEFIENSESITCEHRMTPSEIVSIFGDELTPKEIDRIYLSCPSYVNTGSEEDLFREIDRKAHDMTHDGQTVLVVHCVWKALRMIGFLTFIGKSGYEEERFVVDENYELNKDAGDVRIKWEWIPEVYETWKIRISDPVYVKMRPVPGQFKDLNDLFYSKLPYVGVIYDGMESEPTSLMDRLKIYNYYCNIIFYRIEELMASDMGKKIGLDPAMLQGNKDMPFLEVLHYFRESPFLFLNKKAEGSNPTDSDMSKAVQVIDMSLGNQIKGLIELFENIRILAGKSVGIPEQLEGQVNTSDAVGNTQIAMQQGSAILQPYFDLHDHFKRNVLQALLECAKTTYRDEPEKKLSYVLDDKSLASFTLDTGLLSNTTFGIFMSNSPKIEETKVAIRQLAHSAMQNQAVELSDVISIIQEEDITIAAEKLKVAEQNRREHEMQMQQQQIEANADEAEKARAFERERHEQAKELIVLKESERRETEIVKASIMGASFNPEQDIDNDGVNDFIEIARHGLDVEIQRSQIDLERSKLEHQKKVDTKKLKQEDEKIINDRKKITAMKAKKKV